MDTTHTALLTLLVFVAALLYSIVGHGGASGYLAAMALLGVAPAEMRPVALVLNVGVSLVATVKFARAGRFSWALFWPFALASVPMSFVGGRLGLPARAYKIVVGLVLLYAAARLFIAARHVDDREVRRPPLAVALLTGALLGILSGLTGVGGGIFLSPLLLLVGWAGTRVAAGVAAPFILVNSLAGLLGARPALAPLASLLAWLLPVALLGAWLGAEYGSRRIATPRLRQLLAVVLVVAGLKLATT